MVRVNCEWLLASFEVHAPLTDCLDHRQHLRISDAVVELGWREFPREECDWMLMFEGVVSLGQDCGNGVS